MLGPPEEFAASGHPPDAMLDALYFSTETVPARPARSCVVGLDAFGIKVNSSLVAIDRSGSGHLEPPPGRGTRFQARGLASLFGPLRSRPGLVTRAATVELRPERECPRE